MLYALQYFFTDLVPVGFIRKGTFPFVFYVPEIMLEMRTNDFGKAGNHFLAAGRAIISLTATFSSADVDAPAIYIMCPVILVIFCHGVK